MGCSPSLVLPQVELPYEEIRFLQSSMRNIDKYFHHLYDVIKLQQTTPEIVHVREGVEKSVRSLLNLVSQKYPHFRVKDDDLIKVGSFYEGTKLGKADQFDYIAVLSEIDGDGILLEDINQPLNGLSVNIYVEERKHNHFTEKWKHSIYEDYLLGRKTKHSQKLGILDKFCKCLQKVVGQTSPVETHFGVLEIDKAAGIITDGHQVKINLLLTKSWHIIKDMKKVDITSTENIAITITPAIRWNKNIHDFIEPDDTVSTALYSEVLASGSFLLMTAADGYFQKAFTETEIKLVRNLPVRHLKALCLLKFLFNGVNRLENAQEYGLFPFRLYDSYSLKMWMLANSESCPCQKHSEFELYDCVMHVLQKIHSNLYSKDRCVMIYPHVFITSAASTSSDPDILRINRNAVTELLKHDLKVWIGEKEKYDLYGDVKKYGVVPLNMKIVRTLQALNAR